MTGILVGIGLLGLGGNPLPASCERGSASSRRKTNRSADNASEDDSDPYDNLPEEDEETSCSMCKTFRQGPCGKPWRKMERCMKDHEEEENGVVEHCMKYFTPHHKCLTQYTNLYHLISLDMKQELVRDAELAVTEDERRTWDPPLNLGPWLEFVKDQGLSFCETITSTVRQTGESKVNQRPTPLWKRFPDNLEPVLVTCSAELPLQQTEKNNDLILKIAFAVDQDGVCIGFAFNKEYGALLDMSREAESPTETSQRTTAAAGPTEKESSPDSSFPLEFFVLPGETTHVRICAMYAENPVTAAKGKPIYDAMLYTGPRHPLISHLSRQLLKKNNDK